jgi:hypothetical protein
MPSAITASASVDLASHRKVSVVILLLSSSVRKVGTIDSHGQKASCMFKIAVLTFSNGVKAGVRLMEMRITEFNSFQDNPARLPKIFS